MRVLLTSPPLSPSPSKERGKRFIERGETPLLPTLPLPLLREGGQGDGLLNNLLNVRFLSPWARTIITRYSVEQYAAGVIENEDYK